MWFLISETNEGVCNVIHHTLVKHESKECFSQQGSKLVRGSKTKHLNLRVQYYNEQVKIHWFVLFYFHWNVLSLLNKCVSILSAKYFDVVTLVEFCQTSVSTTQLHKHTHTEQRRDVRDVYLLSVGLPGGRTESNEHSLIWAPCWLCTHTHKVLCLDPIFRSIGALLQPQPPLWWIEQTGFVSRGEKSLRTGMQADSVRVQRNKLWRSQRTNTRTSWKTFPMSREAKKLEMFPVLQRGCALAQIRCVGRIKIFMVNVNAECVEEPLSVASTSEAVCMSGTFIVIGQSKAPL